MHRVPGNTARDDPSLTVRTWYLLPSGASKVPTPCMKPCCHWPVGPSWWQRANNEAGGHRVCTMQLVNANTLY